MKLSLLGFVGQNCITMQDGERVFEKIDPELKAGHDVELDFAGVGVSASPFFNSAIGRLLKDIQPEALNKLLQITNLNDVGMTVLRRVIENSKEYYSNPALREVLDEILSEHAEG